MLIPDKVLTLKFGAETLKVSQKIIPFGMKSSRLIKNSATGAVLYKVGDTIKQDEYIPRKDVKGIVIHNTDDLANVVDDAEQYTRATYNWAMNGVIVTAYIDECGVWQNLVVDYDKTEVGWHAGCGRAIATGNKGVKLNGNQNCPGLEIVMTAKGAKNDIEAEKNGAMYTAYLLWLYGLEVGDVYSHKFFSSYSKECPRFILPHWDKFKDTVQKYLILIRNTKQDAGVPIPKSTTVVESTKPTTTKPDSTPVTSATKQYYKINKTFSNGNWNSTQKGAFDYNESGLKQAIDYYTSHKLTADYFIFDPKGNKVYPIQLNYTNYTIKPNDSWWSVSKSQLGSGSKCNDLAKFNGMTTSSIIHPGQVIKIPK